MKSTATDDRLDRVFKALGDRTRRSMLRRLERGPAMITELAEPYEMSLPAASKHLQVLERAGLVRRDIDGRVHTCSLDPRPLKAVDRWVAHYRAYWSDQLEALARFAEGDDA